MLSGVITVNTTADTNVANDTAGPQDSNGRISLRSAVEYASNNPGPYTIDLPNNLGVYDLTQGGMTLGNPLTNIDLNFTIQGVTSTGALADPATVVIRQTTQNRIFVTQSPPNGMHLTFNNLTIEDGQTPVNNTAGGPANLLRRQRRLGDDDFRLRLCRQRVSQWRRRRHNE